MTRKFTVNPKVWDRFPGMKLILIAGSDLDNKRHRKSVDELLDTAQSDTFETLRWEDFDTFEPVTVWRDVQPGKKFPAAHEALAARVQKRSKLRAINPLVDVYNSLSISFIGRDIAAPIGAWCMSTMSGLRLEITEGGEPFTELGKSKPVSVEAGEVAYLDLDTSELVTRHFVWRQSKLGAVTPKTKAFLLISELLPPYASDRKSVV